MNNECMHFGTCAGCDLLDLPYAEQLKEKELEVKDIFKAWKNLPVKKTMPSPEEYFYRHKVQLPFGHKKGKYEEILTLGLHAKDYSKIIDLKECKIQDEALSAIAWDVRDWAREEKYTAYNERYDRGFLKYLILRKSHFSGEILVCLVTSTPKEIVKKKLESLILKIQTTLSKSELKGKSILAGIIQNINKEKTTMAIGDHERLLWGKKYIKEELGGFKYRVGLSTFIQVNPFQTPRLYEEIIKNVPEGANVIDAYCGIGTISLWLSKKAKSVLGIESNPHSIEFANIAVKENKIRNVKFLVGDSARILSQLEGSHEILVVDPPRSGLERNCVNAILAMNFKKIIYVSCNPETLEEDARNLSRQYTLKSVQPVDMFPQTFHIESVAIFEK
ncbi:MAG TPA: 23S rRNA (uracil(1939)-C(5))-methyltransferase RlmD [Leptospiraceae bacterium]|nr:23S rRNA (uracil(1939)-C(5))-methyltransferase RlmD [Leptospiraceae bacterium]HRG75192.1 23S rRNA (uracil(1939)-C(5))-methyltransferase RlmD [Leptospiraceae bacterium]